MNKLKHTSGPWVKDYGGTIGHIKSIGDNGYCGDDSEIKKTPTVCKYQTEKIIIPKEQQEANARLIACAPEMLDMLIHVVKEGLQCVEHPENKKLMLKTKEAKLIEKATGQKIEDLI